MLRINLLNSINPAKLRDRINEIIHWMWRNELVPGHGIRIDRKVNGIIVSADPPVGGRSGNGAVSSESSGYCGEFKVSVGEIVRSEEEPGEIISLELFIPVWNSIGGRFFFPLNFTDGNFEFAAVFIHGSIRMFRNFF